MKKLMFLIMVCGVFFIAAGSVSAQNCVPKDNEVAFFKDWKFTGECKVFKIGGYLDIEKAGFPDNALSSFKVGNGVTLRLCQEKNYQDKNKNVGECMEYISENEDMSQESAIPNDSVSSFVVFARKNVSANENKSGCSMDKGGNEIPLNWVNKTRFKLRFEWIGFDCQPQEYATVEPNGTFNQETFNGHVWRISYWASESDEPRWIEYKTITANPSNKSMNLTME